MEINQKPQHNPQNQRARKTTTKQERYYKKDAEEPNFIFTYEEFFDRSKSGVTGPHAERESPTVSDSKSSNSFIRNYSIFYTYNEYLSSVNANIIKKTGSCLK
ncbi:hypothetical protein AMECASPLE_028842 [Ameca splendens]|uniref:Uncharacterized protein n=1 Tax=Ameca splendens TaxID=208324 RepID=A0ABV0ZFI2_9TELE